MNKVREALSGQCRGAPFGPAWRRPMAFAVVWWHQTRYFCGIRWLPFVVLAQFSMRSVGA